MVATEQPLALELPEFQPSDPADFVWYCVFAIISQPRYTVTALSLHEGRGLRLWVEGEDIRQWESERKCTEVFKGMEKLVNDILIVLRIGAHTTDHWVYDITFQHPHAETTFQHHYGVSINVYPEAHSFLYKFCKYAYHPNSKPEQMVNPLAIWELCYKGLI
jgi:hypothetical protein